VPAGLQHTRHLGQDRTAIGHVLEHVAQIDEVERSLGEAGRGQLAVEDVEPALAREAGGGFRELHTLRAPAALRRVLDQPAGGAADVEKAPARAEGVEAIEQAAVLGRERRLVERAAGRPAAAIVRFEVLRAIEAAQALRRGLDAEKAQAAAPALDERKGRPLPFVAHGQRTEPGGAAGSAALDRSSGQRRRIGHSGSGRLGS